MKYILSVTAFWMLLAVPAKTIVVLTDADPVSLTAEENDFQSQTSLEETSVDWR